MQFYDKAPLALGDNFGRGGQAVYSALGLNPPADKKEILRRINWLKFHRKRILSLPETTLF